MVDVGGKQGWVFVVECVVENINVFDVIVKYVVELNKVGKWVLLVLWSLGVLECMVSVLGDYGLRNIKFLENWQDVAVGFGIGCVVLLIECGFEIENLVVIFEQDIFGDCLVWLCKCKKIVDVIVEVGSLLLGDFVIYVDYGLL